MSQQIESEIEKKTFWLLRRIKRFYQTFSFKEDDLAMVHDWAETLEPVIDWIREGLMLYVRDVDSGNKRKEPSAADIYYYADKARIKAKGSGANDAQINQTERKRDDQRAEESLNRFYASYGRDRQKELEKARQSKKEPLSPEEMENRRQHMLAVVSNYRKEDLPFASDEEDLKAYEEDPDEMEEDPET